MKKAIWIIIAIMAALAVASIIFVALEMKAVASVIAIVMLVGLVTVLILSNYKGKNKNE